MEMDMIIDMEMDMEMDTAMTMIMAMDLNSLKHHLKTLEIDYFNLICQTTMRRVLTTEISDIQKMAEQIQTLKKMIEIKSKI